MSLATLTEYALSSLVTYGPYALALLLLIGATGIPLPGTVILLAAGAFARQGVIQWQTALILALAGVVLGDSIAYGIGRLGGPSVERRAGGSALWQQAHGQFNRYGGWAIFFTRWLLTPLGVPVSLLSGLGAFVFWRFLLFDIAGEALWVTGYGAIGYAVGSQFEAVGQILNDFSGLLVGAAITAIAAWLAVRIWRRKSPSSALGAFPAHNAMQSVPAIDAIAVESAEALEV